MPERPQYHAGSPFTTDAVYAVPDTAHPNPMSSPPPPPKACPNDGRVEQLEFRVNLHDQRLTTLAETVQLNEQAAQLSRTELTNTVKGLSDGFRTMEAEQKDLPVLVKDLHTAIIGTTERAGIAERVRRVESDIVESKQEEDRRIGTRAAVWLAVLTAVLGVIGTIIVYSITGHAGH